MSASLSMGNVVLSRAFLNALLLAVRPGSTEDHLIVNPKIALLNEDPLSITPDTTLEQLEEHEAAFSGYTAGGSAVTLGAVPVRPSNVVQALAGNVAWVGPVADPFISGGVKGWYLYDDTFGLICSGQFSESVNITGQGSYLDLFAGLPLKVNTSGL